MKKEMAIAHICKFLHDNRVLEKYCFNAQKYHKIFLPPKATPRQRTKIIITTLLEAYIKDYRPHIGRFMSRYVSSFDWRDSPEGYDYWESIDKKWGKYILENKIGMVE